MKELTQDVIDNLSPGICGAVLWLRQRGWETTDSGDGTNYAQGMEGALPCPMVVVHTIPFVLRETADAILADLRGALGDGVGDGPDGLLIEATYFPSSGRAIILVTEPAGGTLLGSLTPSPNE